MAQDFWRWTESRWTSPDRDWKQAAILAAGVDVGSVSTQAVVLADAEIYCTANLRTGSSSPDSATRALNWALEGTGLTADRLHYTVGTGYGRVNVPLARRAITEIACHARGANRMYGPGLRTLLDMGGQDCKVIRVDAQGKVISFLMNDKCAAGTGRGLEVFADLLNVPIDQVGELSLSVEVEPEPVSATCVVFAKTEAAGLLRRGWPRERVLASYCAAMAHRVVALIERLGLERDFAITGGIAKNVGVVRRIERELKVEALPPRLDPQIAGALGAALFGRDQVEKERNNGPGRP